MRLSKIALLLNPKKGIIWSKWNLRIISLTITGWNLDKIEIEGEEI